MKWRGEGDDRGGGLARGGGGAGGGGGGGDKGSAAAAPGLGGLRFVLCTVHWAGQMREARHWWSASVGSKGGSGWLQCA